MQILNTSIDPSSKEFISNQKAFDSIMKSWRLCLRQVESGGGEEAVRKHKARGKMTARERIAKLIDPGTPFLELSALAAWDMYENDAPGAGLVTGIARVSGREIVI